MGDDPAKDEHTLDIEDVEVNEETVRDYLLGHSWFERPAAAGRLLGEFLDIEVIEVGSPFDNLLTGVALAWRQSTLEAIASILGMEGIDEDGLDAAVLQLEWNESDPGGVVNHPMKAIGLDGLRRYIEAYKAEVRHSETPQEE